MILTCYPAAAKDAAVGLFPYVHMFYKGNILHDMIRLGVASGYLVLWVVSSGGLVWLGGSPVGGVIGYVVRKYSRPSLSNRSFSLSFSVFSG